MQCLRDMRKSIRRYSDINMTNTNGEHEKQEHTVEQLGLLTIRHDTNLK